MGFYTNTSNQLLGIAAIGGKIVQDSPAYKSYQLNKQADIQTDIIESKADTATVDDYKKLENIQEEAYKMNPSKKGYEDMQQTRYAREEMEGITEAERWKSRAEQQYRVNGKTAQFLGNVREGQL